MPMPFIAVMKFSWEKDLRRLSAVGGDSLRPACRRNPVETSPK